MMLNEIVKATNNRHHIIIALAHEYDIPTSEIAMLMSRAIQHGKHNNRVKSCVTSVDYNGKSNFARTYHQQTRYAIPKIIDYMKENYST